MSLRDGLKELFPNNTDIDDFSDDDLAQLEEEELFEFLGDMSRAQKVKVRLLLKKQNTSWSGWFKQKGIKIFVKIIPGQNSNFNASTDVGGQTFIFEGDQVKDDETCIVFLGPTGSGKSRLLNSLADQELAEPSVKAQSTNTGVRVFKAELDTNNMKTKYALVDTQGLNDTVLSNSQVTAMIQTGVDNMIPHVNMFVVVVGKGRLTKEQRAALSQLTTQFDLTNHKQNVLIVVTHCELLDTESKQDCRQSLLEIKEIRDLLTQVECVDGETGDSTTRENLLLLGFPNPAEAEEEDQDFARKKSNKAAAEVWNVLTKKPASIDPTTKPTPTSSGWCVIL